MTDRYLDCRYIAVLLADGFDYEEVADVTGLTEDIIEKIAEDPIMMKAVTELEDSGEWGVDIYFAVSLEIGDFIE